MLKNEIFYIPHPKVAENFLDDPNDQQIQFDDYLTLQIIENFPFPTKQN